MAIEKNKPNILKHDKKPFTTILNETIQLIRDPAALGFYTLLASKPEGWDIIEQFLMNHFGVGRDFCRKKMKYLKQVGVIEVVAIRGERGRITGWETKLRVQITENPSSGESTRLLKIQDVVAPESGESAHINKRYIQKKEEYKEENNNAREDAPNLSSNVIFENETKESPWNKPTYDSPKQALKIEDNEGFEEFWSLYPVKASEKSCRVLWNGNCMWQMKEEILAKLREQIAKDVRWIDGYAPNPRRYLEEELWNDEIMTRRAKSGSNSARKSIHDDYDPDDTSWIHKDRGIFNE